MGDPGQIESVKLEVYSKIVKEWLMIKKKHYFASMQGIGYCNRLHKNQGRMQIEKLYF